MKVYLRKKGSRLFFSVRGLPREIYRIGDIFFQDGEALVSANLFNFYELKERGAIFAPEVKTWFFTEELLMQQALEIKKNGSGEGEEFLYAHQKMAIELLSTLKKGALFLEMGLGKTLIFLKLIEKFHEDGDHHLIIAPLSVLESIKEETEKWINLKAKIIKKSEDLYSPEEIFIINYAKIRIMFESLKKFTFKVIVADESHYIKNPKAKRTKLLLKISERGQYKFISTGTPISKNILDIYPQFRFVDPNILGFKNYYAFRARYAIMGGFMSKQVVGIKKQEEILKRIEPFSIRMRKEDCLDLPPQIYETFYVDLSKDQLEVYKKLKKNFLVEIGTQKIISSNILTRFLHFQQITAGFLSGSHQAESQVFKFNKNPKLDLLEEILAEEKERKFIIYTRFLYENKMIKDRLEAKGYKIECLTGKVKSKRRAEIRKIFQEGELDGLVVQIQVGGLGISFTRADIVIYYSNSFSYIERTQSESRVHRAGRKNTVLYLDLIARNTIDVSVLKILKKKREISDYVLNKVRISRFLDGEVLL